MADTIFALSSGQPPAGIAVIRVSGPAAGTVLANLIGGTLPIPRQATLRTLRRPGGEALDDALILWMPGPRTATGEDVAELHCHGGRAVVAAVTDTIAKCAHVREAKPGEFTRRAFINGRMDLAQAEGLGDLLLAETELQRQTAIGTASGALSQNIAQWRDTVLSLSAQVEATLDFSDEDDVDHLSHAFVTDLRAFADELRAVLRRPRVEKLKDGVRVVLAGPPNSGKSSLFNALTNSDAAIVAPIAGTTRDIIERPVAISGIPFVFTDTAGMRAESTDEIENIGIGRAVAMLDRADIVLWLGPEAEGPSDAIEIENFIDVAETSFAKSAPDYRVSAQSGEGVDVLRNAIVARARVLLPKPGEAALNERQYQLVTQATTELNLAAEQRDPLLVGEHLRQVRLAFDAIIGRTSTEDMLDGLFGRFCIGK